MKGVAEMLLRSVRTRLACPGDDDAAVVRTFEVFECWKVALLCVRGLDLKVQHMFF